MKWNPFVNALGASAYIFGVALFMNFITSIRHDTPDTIIDGAAFISLFVFSAATMGFLFFYRPIMLLAEDKKKEAIDFFLKTLSTFGVVTIIVLVLVSTQ